MTLRGTCSSCGAEVRWVKTQKGVPIAIDPVPVQAGTVVLEGEPPSARYLREWEGGYQGERFVAHAFACPGRSR